MTETSEAADISAVKEPKRLIKDVSIKLNCKGDNTCNGLGILNGVQNSGEGGGGTGSTGGDGSVCRSQCNDICSQIHLEQLVSPNSVSRIGQELIYTYYVTNVSGRKISKPIVVSSSLFWEQYL